MTGLDALVVAEDLVHVTGLSAGGYSWSETAVYYKPAADRFYWLAEGGCSCNYFGDDSYTLADFGDGDGDAALRALDDVSHWEGEPSDEERARAKTALRDFRAVPETGLAAELGTLRRRRARLLSDDLYGTRANDGDELDLIDWEIAHLEAASEPSA